MITGLILGGVAVAGAVLVGAGVGVVKLVKGFRNLRSAVAESYKHNFGVDKMIRDHKELVPYAKSKAKKNKKNRIKKEVIQNDLIEM